MRTFFTLLIALLLLNVASAQNYCTPNATGSSNYLHHFGTSGGAQNFHNEYTGFGTGGYTDFSATSAVHQYKGSGIGFTANLEGAPSGLRIWVDWNQDGVFDANEVAFASAVALTSHNSSFTIPYNAQTGPTRMRIATSTESATADVDPCVTAYTQGEFEDYMLHVKEYEDCNTTPVPPNWEIQTNVDAICESGDLNLSVTDPIPSSVNYLFQYSLDGSNWLDVAPASTQTTATLSNLNTDVHVRVRWLCNGAVKGTSSSKFIPVVNLDVDLGEDQHHCYGVQVVLDAGNYPHNPKFLWNTGDTTQKLNVYNSGEYWVKITSINCVATDTVLIEFTPGPEAYAMTDEHLGEGIFQFDLLNTNNIDYYFWDLGDGSPINNDASPIHQYEAVGVYEVTVTIRSDNCVGDKVLDKKIIYKTTSIEDILVEDSKMNVYPNPTKDRVNIEWEEDFNPDYLTLLDITGKELKVVTFKKATKSYILDVSSLVAGVYFLKLNNEKNEVMHRVVVQ